MEKGGLQLCVHRYSIILGEFIFQYTYLHKDSAKDTEAKEWRKM